MTQVITTPDGMEHEFPDNAPDDVIKKTLQSYSSGAQPASTAPKTAMPAALTYDQPGGGILSTLHNLAVGGNLWGKKFQDAATLGGADALQGQLPGQDTAQLRAQTNEAGRQIGPIGSATADIAGYAMAPGKLKIGDSIAAALGAGRSLIPRVGARVLGAATEGGATSGASSLGHGEDLQTAGQDALRGAAIGGATGFLPGGGGPTPVKPSTEDLSAIAKSKYAQLPAKQYQPTDVGNVMDATKANLSPGLKANQGDKLSEQIAKINGIIGDSKSLSADDIASFQRSLLAKARGDTDLKIANLYIDGLNRGVGTQTAGMIKDANAAHNAFKTSGEIDNWLANPNAAPGQVQTALAKKPQFYQQPGVADALGKIGQMGDPPGFWGKLGGHVAGAVGGTALGAGTDYLLGDGHIGSITEGALGTVVLPGLLAARRGARIRAPLRAAQHLVATGSSLPPSAFASPWGGAIGDAARKAGYAYGSANP